MNQGNILPIGVNGRDRSPLAPELVERAERELAFLHLRRRRLPSRRLSDAHWAILLDLYVAHAQRREVGTRDLEAASGVPSSTLLRYLDALEQRQLITRSSAEYDRRVTRVKATDQGLARIAAILGEAAGADGVLETERFSKSARR